MCTETEVISLPEEKLRRAQEFLAHPCFDPGVTRMDLKVLQELRRKAEHWSLCNSSLSPELHVIDKLLCSNRGISRPHGTDGLMKQCYFEFWDTMEVFRINMSDPEWWYASYRSPFCSVLTLPERMSFNIERDKAVWVGSDATLHTCATVDHTHKVFTVFDMYTYVDYLSELTGLPRGDYELIAIAEFFSLIAFLIVRAPTLRSCIVCYVGDSQNVVTWVRERRPGNRVAKYFIRIRNRLESENEFLVSPMYISTLRSKFPDDLSRLEMAEAMTLGTSRGMTFVDV